jgi:hypothetical protein
MDSTKPKLFIFGWPSFLGGADTKLAHLLVLLHRHCEITVVPNENRHLHNKIWTKSLDKLRVKYALFEKLPAQLDGFGLALSNQLFFSKRIAHRAKAKGLKIIWSSEMMWHHEGELEAVKAGIVDKVLYTSEFQKSHLSSGYESLPSSITGNYIDPNSFPFVERTNATFTIGRLSRPDPLKYPENFPVFYESLRLPDTRFRVMAWDDKLKHKYRWHRFDDRWDLLKTEQESQVNFLHSLDLFVYPLGHGFKESWGRSTVEAMLTGCIPLAPAGHHFENLMVHGESGFICRDFLEYKHHAHDLYFNYVLRKQMAAQCRAHAVNKLCDRKEHRRIWMEVFQ